MSAHNTPPDGPAEPRLIAEKVRVVKVTYYQSQCPTCGYRGSLYVHRRDAVEYNTCRCGKAR